MFSFQLTHSYSDLIQSLRTWWRVIPWCLTAKQRASPSQLLLGSRMVFKSTPQTHECLSLNLRELRMPLLGLRTSIILTELTTLASLPTLKVYLPTPLSLSESRVSKSMTLNFVQDMGFVLFTDKLCSGYGHCSFLCTDDCDSQRISRFVKTMQPKNS